MFIRFAELDRRTEDIGGKKLKIQDVEFSSEGGSAPSGKI